MLLASFIITVLSASMLKIAHMREKWERKLQVSHYLLVGSLGIIIDRPEITSPVVTKQILSENTHWTTGSNVCIYFCLARMTFYFVALCSSTYIRMAYYTVYEDLMGKRIMVLYRNNNTE